jgi:hypothetical protein
MQEKSGTDMGRVELSQAEPKWREPGYTLPSNWTRVPWLGDFVISPTKLCVVIWSEDIKHLESTIYQISMPEE